MKLSIITINYNNAMGLQKTLESVFSQTSTDFEYIVVDGASTDGSVEIIESFDFSPDLSLKEKDERIHLTWISEKDNGIYQAMNKGISLANGEYVQFLNSGDVLTAPEVTARMLAGMTDCDILYGNMLKQLPTRLHRDRGFEGRNPTMLDFYTGTLNHSPAYIKKRLFEIYGLYDENLKIVSDYKWYLKVIIMNGIIPVYKDVDVTLFDMNGISTINTALDKTERRKVLEEVLPLTVLRDYEQYSFPIEQCNRLNRYWLTRYGFRLVERLLFKWEKCLKKENNHICKN